jgi:hypothetical protein
VPVSKRGAQRLESVESEQEALRALWEAFGRHQQRDRARREAAPPLSDAELLRMRIEESQGDTDPFTKALLGTAVPMWIDRMRHWRWEYRKQVADELVDIIAYDQGIAAMCDAEARGTARKGDLTRCFNAVAQGLAILAFCPGGIVFAGYHWEVAVQGEPA